MRAVSNGAHARSFQWGACAQFSVGRMRAVSNRAPASPIPCHPRPRDFSGASGTDSPRFFTIAHDGSRAFR